MNPEKPQNQEYSSSLAEIIKASQEAWSTNTTSIDNSSDPSSSDIEIASVPPTIDPQAMPISPNASLSPSTKTRAPLPPGTILKWIGALFFAAIIFFASFLAYIVFNPWEAQFFIVMFGIDTKDVATILRKFINWSFGIIMLVVSILWLITLFKAIWTPREQKRKKILAWMTAALIWIFLFSVLTFWIYLFKKIGEIVWDGWLIGIYDNSLYSNPISESVAELNNTKNIIGPITLRYDIRGNAKSHEANGSISIERYEINFDGAQCADGRSIVTGTGPKEEQWIVCVFDQIKEYNVRWTYFGKDTNGENIEIPMDLDAVEVRGLIDIREQKNSSGKDIVTLDASRLKLLGESRFVYENTWKEVRNPTLTVEPSETPVFISLKVFWEATDRIFLIQKRGLTDGNERIDLIQSNVNSLDFTLMLTGITIDATSILGIEWTSNDGIVICRKAREICHHNFGSYGTHKIGAKIYLADKTSREVTREINVEEPLRLTRHVIVTWSDGKRLNPDSSYDKVLNTYIIDNIIPPDKIALDARDVVPENPWYELREVRWTLSDWRDTLEKVGERVTFDISNTYRYTVVWTYTFEKNIPWNTPEIKNATDTVTIDVEHKTLIPRLTILQDSDYVPVTLTADASQSWSENNEIIKFIYNFGEWKSDAVGDAIQTYEYTTPGEKEITLTIIDDSGERSQVKKTIVLKESPRTIWFNPSISPWIVWVPIDFSVTWESGQVESYTWSFSDNTPTQRGLSVTHSFSEAREYQVTLTAIYNDGTQKQAISTFRVAAQE
jgi:PKD domain